MLRTAELRRERTRRLLLHVPAALLLATSVAVLGCSSGVRAQGPSSGPGADKRAATGRGRAAGTRHYEYVIPDGSVYVYDMDAGQRLLRRIALPIAKGVRGVLASPRTHTLYISYGGDGGSAGSGSLLAFDLLSNRPRWHRHYTDGIDSMAMSPDGRRIYMPTGELDGSGTWHVLAASDGHVIGTIQGGAGAHNTVMSLSGRHVYLGGRNYNYLDVADTSTGQVVRRIGPLRGGVRPFTINGRETLAFTTATGFLGFQVSSIAFGRVLYTETFPGYGWSQASFAPSAPSHGISLSPDERQLWAMDAPNSTVHAFDVSGLPDVAPRLLANVRLSAPMSGEEEPCAYDCTRDGWLQHSRDGRFVYVGDSGDVIDASTFHIVGYLPALRQTRKMLEIDWRAGRPVATTSRQGLGYVR
jgi:DNA-binding beta-propeller fold protein YncE